MSGLLTMGDPKAEINNRMKLIDVSKQVSGAGSVSPSRDGEAEFELELREVERGEEKHLPETYKGVLICVEYKACYEKLV